MPVGLTNSPVVFQRLMEVALRGLKWHMYLIYLDDVFIFGPGFEENMIRLEDVLSRIRDACLNL